MKKCLVFFLLFLSINVGLLHGFALEGADTKKIPSCNDVSQKVLEIWTILDMLRSVTIEPQARIFFITTIVHDMISILCDVAALRVQCCCCADFYKNNKEDIVYLQEMVEHVFTTFMVVMHPFVSGEEELLGHIMKKIADIVDHLQDPFLKEDLYHESP